jgi:hypothetical protein
MRRLQPVQTLLEQRTEPVVGLDVVGEERVATASRALQQDQEGGSGGLNLVAYVAMVCDRARPRSEELLCELISGPAVNEMDLRESLGRTTGGVDVLPAC